MSILDTEGATNENPFTAYTKVMDHIKAANQK